MVAGRAGKRETTEAHRVDRRACGQQRRLQGRLGADRVRVDQTASRADPFDQLGRVTAEDVGFVRTLAFGEPEAGMQRVESCLRLGMRARRMEPSEGFVTYELDGLEDTAASRMS